VRLVAENNTSGFAQTLVLPVLTPSPAFYCERPPPGSSGRLAAAAASRHKQLAADADRLYRHGRNGNGRPMVTTLILILGGVLLAALATIYLSII
jgi:hypothetical protein